MECPDALRKAATYRKLALFVGSGISAEATNKASQHPPTWPDLLRELSSFTTGKTREQIVSLIDKNQLLLAAELLRYSIRKSNKEIEFNKQIKSLSTAPEVIHLGRLNGMI